MCKQNCGITNGKPHPWEKWFDGRKHKLIKGRDYCCQTASLKSLIYTRAAVLNKRAGRNLYQPTVTLTRNGLTVQNTASQEEPRFTVSEFMQVFQAVCECLTP